MRGARGMAVLGVALASLLPAHGCRRAAAPSRTLVVLMRGEITTLDPHATFDDTSWAVLANLYDSLVRFDQKLRLAPALARSWVNPDERTWRFFLDPEARFPDGSALTAADVKFSIERQRSLAGSQFSGFVRQISGVEVLDERTVEVRTEVPVAVLNGLALVPVVSERHVRAAGERTAEEPFGTGAYRLARWEQGKSVVLEANPHHRRRPAIERVEFVLVDEGRYVDELVARRPQLGLFLPRFQLKAIQDRLPPGLRVLRTDGLAVHYLTLNVRPTIPGRPGPNPLRDPRVREALARALDRPALVQATLEGLARPASQMVVSPVFGFDPELDAPPYDPAAARRLLAEAGHPNLELPIQAATGGQLLEQVAKQWRAVGVRARLEEQPVVELQRALESGRFTVSLEGYGCTSGDASEILTYSLQTRDERRGYGAGNSSGYSNAEVDRLTEENLRVLDPEVRRAMLKRALWRVAHDLPYIPLVATGELYVVANALRWSAPVNGEVRLETMSLAEEAR
jgi:peptide/nickel transport system substrate-binding protein